MKILQRKSDGALHVTAQDEKPLSKAEFTRVTPRSLTTLDFIALVALTVLQPVLFHALRTDEDNPQERVDKIKEE